VALGRAGKPDRIERGWPLWALGLVGLAVHAREILGGRPYFRDFLQVYVPAKMYLAERLKAGELPQWWPWDGGGSPLIPQPVFSVFHPTTLLYGLLPFWGAFTAQNLCGTWLALFGAYALARVLGLPRPAAAVSGALYGVSGYLACLSEHQFMKLAAGTMPWYLAALIVADRRRGAWLVLPGMAMGLLLLAGDPQIAMLASVAGLALILARSRHRWRALVLALASPVMGAILAAVQLGPSLGILPDTERGYVMVAERWAMEPSQLLGFLWPVDYGPTAWVRSTIFGWAGVGLVLASIVGLRQRRRRPTIVALGALTLLSLWLALGNDYGLNRLARAGVPLWAQLRYPMKSIVLAYLTLAILAGYGFVQLAARRSRRDALMLASLALVVGPLAMFATTGLQPWPLFTLAGALIGVMGLAGTRLGAALVMVQATALAVPLFLTTEAAYYEPSPLAQALRREGIGLTGFAFDRPFAQELNPYDWPASSRAGAGGLGTSLGAVYGLPTLTPSMPGASWRLFKLFGPEHMEITNGRLLGVYGVGAVVMREPVEERLRPQVIATEHEFSYAAVRLRHRLSRAYAVAQARAVGNAAEAVDAVTGSAFAPGREIIVESATPKPAWSLNQATPSVPAVVEPRASANHVRIQATLPWPGFVVLNETMFRGWSATVDGQPTPILTANALVRAVEAPAGQHEIEFTFHTPGLAAGALLSALAWLMLVPAAMVLRRRATRG
jgi:hypothetical protein